jgi:putative FmdB family regulatory protein
MILADFECTKCGNITEEICHSGKKKSNCPECGKVSKRIISQGRVYAANEDSPGARDSIRHILDMEVAVKSSDPVERAAARNPNRSNLKALMKSKNLRYAENEKGAPPVYKKPEPHSREQILKEVWDKHRARKSLSISLLS